jgi:hypothetical protein
MAGETSDIRKKYLPIFLKKIIVTGNQMFITSYSNNVYETAPSKTIWVFSWLYNALIYHFKY